MGLHGTRAIEARPGANAAADGFIILVARIAKKQVVHGGLGGSAGTKGGEQRITGHLADLGIAGHHRGAGARRQESSFRDHDFQRLQATIIERNILAD